MAVSNISVGKLATFTGVFDDFLFVSLWVCVFGIFRRDKIPAHMEHSNVLVFGSSY